MPANSPTTLSPTHLTKTLLALSRAGGQRQSSTAAVDGDRANGVDAAAVAHHESVEPLADRKVGCLNYDFAVECDRHLAFAVAFPVDHMSGVIFQVHGSVGTRKLPDAGPANHARQCQPVRRRGHVSQVISAVAARAAIGPEVKTHGGLTRGNLDADGKGIGDGDGSGDSAVLFWRCLLGLPPLLLWQQGPENSTDGVLGAGAALAVGRVLLHPNAAL